LRPDARAAGEELLAFVRRHAKSGAVYAPGVEGRVEAESPSLQ